MIRLIFILFIAQTAISCGQLAGETDKLTIEFDCKQNAATAANVANSSLPNISAVVANDKATSTIGTSNNSDNGFHSIAYYAINPNKDLSSFEPDFINYDSSSTPIKYNLTTISNELDYAELLDQAILRTYPADTSVDAMRDFVKSKDIVVHQQKVAITLAADGKLKLSGPIDIPRFGKFSIAIYVADKLTVSNYYNENYSGQDSDAFIKGFLDSETNLENAVNNGYRFGFIANIVDANTAKLCDGDKVSSFPVDFNPEAFNKTASLVDFDITDNGYKIEYVSDYLNSKSEIVKSGTLPILVPNQAKTDSNSIGLVSLALKAKNDYRDYKLYAFNKTGNKIDLPIKVGNLEQIIPEYIKLDDHGKELGLQNVKWSNVNPSFFKNNIWSSLLFVDPVLLNKQENSCYFISSKWELGNNQNEIEANDLNHFTKLANGRYKFTGGQDVDGINQILANFKDKDSNLIAGDNDLHVFLKNTAAHHYLAPLVDGGDNFFTRLDNNETSYTAIIGNKNNAAVIRRQYNCANSSSSAFDLNSNTASVYPKKINRIPILIDRLADGNWNTEITINLKKIGVSNIANGENPALQNQSHDIPNCANKISSNYIVVNNVVSYNLKELILPDNININLDENCYFQVFGPYATAEYELVPYLKVKNIEDFKAIDSRQKNNPYSLQNYALLDDIEVSYSDLPLISNFSGVLKGDFTGERSKIVVDEYNQGEIALIDNIQSGRIDSIDFVSKARFSANAQTKKNYYGIFANKFDLSNSKSYYLTDQTPGIYNSKFSYQNAYPFANVYFHKEIFGVGLIGGIYNPNTFATPINFESIDISTNLIDLYIPCSKGSSLFIGSNNAANLQMNMANINIHEFGVNLYKPIQENSCVFGSLYGVKPISATANWNGIQARNISLNLSSFVSDIGQPKGQITIGGLVANNMNSGMLTLNNSSYTGNINLKIDADLPVNVGGIMGVSSPLNINNSFYNGSVIIDHKNSIYSSTSNDTNFVGGLVGYIFKNSKSDNSINLLENNFTNGNFQLISGRRYTLAGIVAISNPKSQMADILSKINFDASRGNLAGIVYNNSMDYIDFSGELLKNVIYNGYSKSGIYCITSAVNYYIGSNAQNVYCPNTGGLLTSLLGNKWNSPVNLSTLGNNWVNANNLNTLLSNSYPDKNAWFMNQNQ